MTLSSKCLAKELAKITETNDADGQGCEILRDELIRTHRNW